MFIASSQEKNLCLFLGVAALFQSWTKHQCLDMIKVETTFFLLFTPAAQVLDQLTRSTKVPSFELQHST